MFRSIIKGGTYMSWSWFSYDVDNDDSDDYTSKTTVNDSGRVDRFDSTDGSWSSGHGHVAYTDMDDFLEDKDNGFRRGPYDSDSIGHKWDDKT